MRQSRFPQTEIVYAVRQNKMGYSATTLMR